MVKEFIPSFNELKDKYDSKGFRCESGSAGYVYSYKYDRLLRIPCNNYSCKKCRPRLKHELHDNVCQIVDSNNLNYHMIITFPGSHIRKQIPYYQSYSSMSKDWNRLRNVIKYRYPDFNYIVFPRAQADPKPGNPIGYCHYHVIHNKEINKDWLESKTKKYALGYTFLRFNEDVAGYLHNDFYIDDEWIIPKNIKHYRSSRNLILRPGQGYQMDSDSIYFPRGIKINKIEEIINNKYQRPLPFEEYIIQFSKTIA